VNACGIQNVANAALTRNTIADSASPTRLIVVSHPRARWRDVPIR
jgi:hypothetical protein